MNGHENPASTIENRNNSLNNENIQNVQRKSSNENIELKTKNSRLMIISLTFHSLGIIFGDM
jgi:hypothetical protein